MGKRKSKTFTLCSLASSVYETETQKLIQCGNLNSNCDAVTTSKIKWLHSSVGCRQVGFRPHDIRQNMQRTRNFMPKKVENVPIYSSFATIDIAEIGKFLDRLKYVKTPDHSFSFWWMEELGYMWICFNYSSAFNTYLRWKERWMMFSSINRYLHIVRKISKSMVDGWINN